MCITPILINCDVALYEIIKAMTHHRILLAIFHRSLSWGFKQLHKSEKRRLRLRSRLNDPNISTQHIATLLGATCCVCLATLLWLVATCWVFLAQIWKWSNFSCDICGCCMTLYSFGQVRATVLRLGMCTSSICNTQNVATRRNRVAKRT